ncbi:hypothetical protein [Actinokineospora sp.]|uniref:hypothetical protein n=1 Tax=Actinokineospora sp. TaxID=1872133 RepID=UPI00403775E4
MSARLRVVLAELGADSAAHPVARELRDAGAEVIYTGHAASPAQVVDTVLQEDADAVAVDERGDTVAALLAERDAADIVVLGLGDAVAWAAAHHGR